MGNRGNYLNLNHLFINSALLLLLPFILYLFVAWVKFRNTPKRYYKRIAKKTLRKIQSSTNDDAIQKLLNEIPPFAFEELVSLSLKRCDSIKRAWSSGYTRDGGIDGYALIKGVNRRNRVAIQCKRYKGHINPHHIARHFYVCRKINHLGWFFYIGKISDNGVRLAKQRGITLFGQKELVAIIKTKTLDVTAL